LAGFETIAVILLAAGHSRRFGTPKLASPLYGRPLAQHAGETLAALPFLARIAVTGADDLGLAELGFDIVALTGEDHPMSASLAAGMATARVCDPAAVMLVLADMPFVTGAHLEALVRGFDGDRVASSDGAEIMPPAIFGQGWFARLSALSGDKGARELLSGARAILAPAGSLADIDTPADLRTAEV
jgi:molybdenum cofactor cytidylyltransferase